MKAKYVKAFNEWMRRFIESPDEFAREFESVQQFLKDSKRGKEPSYGESCAEYFSQLMSSKTAKAK